MYSHWPSFLPLAFWFMYIMRVALSVSDMVSCSLCICFDYFPPSRHMSKAICPEGGRASEDPSPTCPTHRFYRRPARQREKHRSHVGRDEKGRDDTRRESGVYRAKWGYQCWSNSAPGGRHLARTSRYGLYSPSSGVAPDKHRWSDSDAGKL